MDSPVRLYWLDPRDPTQAFPDPRLAMKEPNGLLAIGGDLSVQRLIRAYSQGIFPWYNPDEPILWWSPDPRVVFPLDDSPTPRTVRRLAARNDYAVTLDRAFDQVIAACAAPRPNQRGTWLGHEMQRAYRNLHDEGYAHSVEVWRDGALIGGLYGLALGRAFFGESMFSRSSGGSKLAIHWIRRQLRHWNFDLFDCQVGSEHLSLLGARDMPREQFINRVHLATSRGHRRGPWRFDIDAPASALHVGRS
ncbi:leucyl/phenylalanyl-tRNA--protein transferase [uncultured Abyssibacter sp.]|uniref:leucyl/phenylalanyl-tRNA--protein transferase n=1 Tax=uncultured Abyssibacter sp. TaxID=2320202 RepID=UPI0032B24CD5